LFLPPFHSRYSVIQFTASIFGAGIVKATNSEFNLANPVLGEEVLLPQAFFVELFLAIIYVMVVVRLNTATTDDESHRQSVKSLKEYLDAKYKKAIKSPVSASKKSDAAEITVDGLYREMCRVPQEGEKAVKGLNSKKVSDHSISMLSGFDFIALHN
jgi:hypothetical protein